MPVQFLVHQKGDDVGVVTVEGIKAGQEIEGRYQKENEPITFTVLNDIPVGHKIALRDMKVGHKVIKYGIIIGEIKADVKQGEHVHIHNLKTLQW